MSFDPIEVNLNKKTTEELFTDRMELRSEFWSAYDALEAGKIEIIHFYGEGGIGKTALLHELIRGLMARGANGSIYSLADSKDKDDFFFTMAYSIGRCFKHADFSLFFYAYTKYLKEKKYTDEQIKAKISNPLNEGKPIADVSKLAMTAATDVVGSIAEVFIPNSFLKIGEIAIDEIWRHVRNRIKDDPESKLIIDRIDRTHEDDLLVALQDSFVHDCRDALKNTYKPFVIMLDDYEYLQSSNRKKDFGIISDLWISGTTSVPGLVQSIPNIMWVISGRERVHWNENILPEKNCFAVTQMDKKYIIEYFNQAKDAQGNSMNPELKEGLCALTRGVPMFMRMCFEQYENGKCREIVEFGKDTREIAERYFKNSTLEEQIATQFLCGLPNVFSDHMTDGVLDKLLSVRPRTKFSDVSMSYISQIKEKSFVDRIADNYKIHDVYRRVVRAEMDPSDLKRITDTVNDYYADVISNEGLSDKERGDALVLLADNVDDYIEIEDRIRDVLTTNLSILNNLGKYVTYSQIAKRLFDGYKNYIDKAQIDIHEADLEVKKRYFQTLSNHAQGELFKNPLEAVALYYQSYTIAKEFMGEDDIGILNIMNDLSVAYSEIGDHAKARGLICHVYKKRREILGETHADTLRAMNNLAKEIECDDPEARDIALAIKEQLYEKMTKVYGETHPDTLIVKYNIATGYFESDTYEDVQKAFEMYKDMLEQYIVVLGEDHPDTINVMCNLAYLYERFDDHAKAVEMSKRVYEKRKEIFGEEHPLTRNALKNYQLVIK